MSKEDEMFEELGYDKNQHFESFRKEAIFYNKEIYFNVKDNDMRISVYNKTAFEHSLILLSMQELQAINEKCKELGWL